MPVMLIHLLSSIVYTGYQVVWSSSEIITSNLENLGSSIGASSGKLERGIESILLWIKWDSNRRPNVHKR
jgi:hypothetical protein